MVSPGNLQIIREEEGPVVRVAGELDSRTCPEFLPGLEATLPSAASRLTLDITDLDIDDEAGFSEAINVIRELARRRDGITLRGAPQMLAHNLYKSGLLRGKRAIHLVDTRQDEPID